MKLSSCNASVPEIKQQWVANLTVFFENFSKHRNSFKRNKRLSTEKKKPEDIKTTMEPDNMGQCISAEHCCTVEKGKEIFDNHNFIAGNRSNSVGEPFCSVNNGKQTVGKSYSVSTTDSISDKSRTPYKYSSYDIFSGKADMSDIPSIESDNEEDDPRASSNFSNKFHNSANNGNVSKRKRSNPMKSNFYNNRKGHDKKHSISKSFIPTSDADKENEGVLIRMRNQESYYDGKDKYQSQLPEAPLYQVYENTRQRRSNFVQNSHEKAIDSIDYELSNDAIQNSIIFPRTSLPSVDENCKFHERTTTRDEDNESDELEPNIDNDSFADNRVFQLFSANSQRLRWAETEEGKKLIKMQKLSEDIIKWQEAQFEVITSEASYYRSLEVLVNKIYKSVYMDCAKERRNAQDNLSPEPDDPTSPFIKPIITATQKHHLFSNILEIHIVSGELLKALESRWRENPLIKDLSDILVDFCSEKLKPYITYLRNQRFQTDTYNKLLNFPEFLNIIKQFENDPDCSMMNLCSFLMLPMQRVLRLKLLMAVVKHHIPKGYPTDGCDKAIEALEKLIKECSDEKMVMEQKEEILLICNRLIIKDKMNVSIGSKPLLKNGSLKVISNNKHASKLLGSSLLNRNNNRAQLYLFEDQLIIAKQRKLPLCVSSDDNREVVVDTCQRFNVKFIEIDPKKTVNRLNFKLILSNGRKGLAEYICSVDSSDDLNEWKNVFTVDQSRREEFDFCEAFAIRNYTPTSKKEIELKKGQILNIIKRINSDRAIASSGEKQGEILLSCVQYVSTPQPNPELINEIRLSVCSRVNQY